MVKEFGSFDDLQAGFTMHFELVSAGLDAEHYFSNFWRLILSRVKRTKIFFAETYLIVAMSRFKRKSAGSTLFIFVQKGLSIPSRKTVFKDLGNKNLLSSLLQALRSLTG